MLDLNVRLWISILIGSYVAVCITLAWFCNMKVNYWWNIVTHKSNVGRNEINLLTLVQKN